MSNAIIFDFSLIYNDERCVWIVDRKNTSKPIIKISGDDFNLIKKGVYKSHKHPIMFNGDMYWLPNSLYNKVPSNIDMALSFSEFINSDYINDYSSKITDNVDILKNIKSDIYLITDKFTRKHKVFLDKIVDILKNEHGIIVKSVITIRKNILDMNQDIISLYEDAILSMYIGKQIHNNKVTDISIDRYNKITFIGDNKVRFINMIDKIKYLDVDNIDVSFVVAEMTNNAMNRLMVKKYRIKK